MRTGRYILGGFGGRGDVGVVRAQEIQAYVAMMVISEEPYTQLLCPPLHEYFVESARRNPRWKLCEPLHLTLLRQQKSNGRHSPPPLPLAAARRAYVPLCLRVCGWALTPLACTQPTGSASTSPSC